MKPFLLCFILYDASYKIITNKMLEVRHKIILYNVLLNIESPGVLALREREKQPLGYFSQKIS